MSAIGKVTALCKSENYAVIDPVNGDPSVVIDADEFGYDWRDLAPGGMVRYSVRPGMRGLRAYNVMVLDPEDSVVTACREHAVCYRSDAAFRSSYEQLI